MILANDILMFASSRVFIEPAVNTTLGTAVVAGTNTVTPPSMSAIYDGAMMVVGSGATQEVITASAVTGTTFDATFVNAHAANDLLAGGTFPTGQPDDILFTQDEVLGYLTDVTNDFLLKTRAIINITQSAFAAGVRTYLKPLDAIRIERISRQDAAQTTTGYGQGGFGEGPYGEGQTIPAKIFRLWDVSQMDLDCKDPNWTGDTGRPGKWYEDQLDQNMYGVYPLPGAGFVSNIWYSQLNYSPLLLNSALLVPDIMAYIPYYGMLARMFGKDGELRDPLRQQYCKKRYDIGVEIVVRLFEGLKPGVMPGPPMEMMRA